MTGTPKVSIGFPVYNGEKYLAHALTRLLQQDFKDFELIICDNASTDRTREICLEFAAQDRRICYFRNDSNIGLGGNHTRTFELSHGRYFKWAAHDDDFPPNMLSRFVKALDEGPDDVSLVYSYCEYIDAWGNVQETDSDGVACDDQRPHKRLSHFLRRVHMYNCTYGMMRSELLRKTHIHGRYPGADYVLFAELAMVGKLVEIAEPLLRIRRHPGRSFTANTNLQALRELFSPGSGRALPFMTLKTRMKLELLRSAVLVPSSLKDKVLCTAAAAIVPQWRSFRNFGGRQKQKFLRIFHPASSLS
jgi:glycosyltransferase involved in cell wall biosynthesis